MTSGTPLDESKSLLRLVTEKLGWKSLKGDLVIDIGCGNGRSSKEVVQAFPEVRKVIGIDISEQRLIKAETYNPDRRIVYELADIRNKFTLARWVGAMDKAVSSFCFNCLDDEMRLGYENMFSLLKPGGEAAFVQSLHSAYYDCLQEMYDSPKWNIYFQNFTMKLPRSHFQSHTTGYYKNLLKEVGFEIVDICEDPDTYGKVFPSNDDCINTIYSSCQLVTLLPIDKREEFMADAFQVFQKYNKRDSQGRLIVEHCTFSAFLRKPKTPTIESNIRVPE